MGPQEYARRHPRRVDLSQSALPGAPLQPHRRSLAAVVGDWSRAPRIRAAQALSRAAAAVDPGPVTRCAPR